MMKVLRTSVRNNTAPDVIKVIQEGTDHERQVTRSRKKPADLRHRRLSAAAGGHARLQQRGGDKNHAPTITALTANPTTVATGGQVALACTAQDQDGDALTYAWTCSGGVVGGAGANVNWTAPNTAGACTITCTVNDGKEKATATQSVNVTVIQEFDPTGTWALEDLGFDFDDFTFILWDVDIDFDQDKATGELSLRGFDGDFTWGWDGDYTLTGNTLTATNLPEMDLGMGTTLDLTLTFNGNSVTGTATIDDSIEGQGVSDVEGTRLTTAGVAAARPAGSADKDLR
jgi:hypothetical protein